MDIYFIDGEYIDADKYSQSCVTVDFVQYNQKDHIRIWVDESHIDVHENDAFYRDAQNLLNAHYYEYVIFMNKYLARKKCNKI
jgi:hypothetical protein